MPVRRLTEEEKARRKAERQLIREQKKAMRDEEKARKKAMRDEEKKQRQAIGKVPSQKQIDNQLRKARLQILKTQEKQRVRMAKQELLAQKKALKDAREQAKNNKKYNIATKRSIAQEMRQAKVNMKPAEKLVMKSSFIGALLPTQRRTLSKEQKDNIYWEKANARRARQGLLPYNRAPGNIVENVAIPVAPVAAPVRRGRGRPRRVQDVNII